MNIRRFALSLTAVLVLYGGTTLAAPDEPATGGDSPKAAGPDCAPGTSEDGLCPDEEAEVASHRGDEEAQPQGAADDGWFKKFSDFMDVWITFTLSDDNLRYNDSFTPSMDINDRRDEPDITGAHLVLYKGVDGFIPHLWTEAGLVLQFPMSDSSVNFRKLDDGSFVGIRYDFNKQKTSYLEFTGFPFNAERFLMGYSYEVTWGGYKSWPQNDDPVAGLRLTSNVDFGDVDIYLLAGTKIHRQTNRDQLDSSSGASAGSVRTTYAGLFGAGVRYQRPVIGPQLLTVQLDASGGFIQKGDNPQISERDLEQAGIGLDEDDIMATGVSGRLYLGLGDPIGDPLDMGLYRRDPRNIFTTPGQDSYRGEWAVSLSFDTTYMAENLRAYVNPYTTDSALSQRIATTSFDALGMVVNLKGRFLTHGRVHATYIYRNLPFLLFDGPHGDPPFYAFPSNESLDDPSTPYQDSSVTMHGEHWLRLHADYRIDPIRLTLGVGFEYHMPARKELVTRTVNAQTGAVSETTQITVFKNRETSSSYSYLTEQVRAVLPPGVEAQRIMGVKFTARYEFSEMLSAQVEVGYTEDPNIFKYVNSGGNLVKIYEDDDVTNPVSLALVLQAKF